MRDILIVGIAGFFGSITRYLVYLWLNPRNPISGFPLATLLINVSGCFIIGLVGSLVAKAVPYHHSLVLIVSVGFLGAYTTFSAFGFETYSLLHQGQSVYAVISIISNVCLGVLAVGIGRALALSLF